MCVAEAKKTPETTIIFSATCGSPCPSPVSRLVCCTRCRLYTASADHNATNAGCALMFRPISVSLNVSRLSCRVLGGTFHQQPKKHYQLSYSRRSPTLCRYTGTTPPALSTRGGAASAPTLRRSPNTRGEERRDPAAAVAVPTLAEIAVARRRSHRPRG